MKSFLYIALVICFVSPKALGQSNNNCEPSKQKFQNQCGSHAGVVKRGAELIKKFSQSTNAFISKSANSEGKAQDTSELELEVTRDRNEMKAMRTELSNINAKFPECQALANTCREECAAEVCSYQVSRQEIPKWTSAFEEKERAYLREMQRVAQVRAKNNNDIPFSDEDRVHQQPNHQAGIEPCEVNCGDFRSDRLQQMGINPRLYDSITAAPQPPQVQTPPQPQPIAAVVPPAPSISTPPPAPVQPVVTTPPPPPQSAPPPQGSGPVGSGPSPDGDTGGPRNSPNAGGSGSMFPAGGFPAPPSNKASASDAFPAPTVVQPQPQVQQAAATVTQRNPGGSAGSLTSERSSTGSYSDQEKSAMSNQINDLRKRMAAQGSSKIQPNGGSAGIGGKGTLNGIGYGAVKKNDLPVVDGQPLPKGSSGYISAVRIQSASSASARATNGKGAPRRPAAVAGKAADQPMDFSRFNPKSFEIAHRRLKGVQSTGEIAGKFEDLFENMNRAYRNYGSELHFRQ